ncbi:hypothetical protein FNV43_RR26934 [Rhamnella rubrinervis]|uniref:TPX2 C-terminal domain-containing protein n=1 Tax=Rhamnella rubrinervis TaxID=2594499 RepID=A0A8K0DQU4_9ROSA|nr:hypothetical protein FNV43_RR26934 [Rhamnella rubrinervis]
MHCLIRIIIMAGEIEEPFSISFQADSLHSGSISFGRFENEPLSWERRSSFSHNRYLEEVEKYSKPGLVVEKKAYFEAHFKKKGLIQPGLSSCYNGTGCQVSENNVLENNSGREEFEHVNEDGHYAHFDESPEGSDYLGEYEVTENETAGPGCSEYHQKYEGTECEGANPGGSEYQQECEVTEYEIEGSRVSFSNPQMEPESDPGCSEYHQKYEGTECDRADPRGSEYQQECEVTEYEIEGSRVSLANPQVEPESDNDDGLQIEHVDSENMHQTETGCDMFSLINVESEIKLNQNHNGNAVNADESSHSIDLSPKTEEAAKVDKTELERLRASSPKLKSTMESKSSIAGVICKSTIPHGLRNISGDLCKGPAKISCRREREASQRINAAKQSSNAAIPTAPSVHSIPKLEDSRGLKGKLIHDNRSGEKELKGKSLNAEPKGRKMASRTNRAVNCTKPDTRSSAAGFSFKSDERAERRKEFYLKLEKKMHAKEAEMNKIQAKTQEKTEAEIKQLRKSLNFKATPMPSFYHVAVPPRSDGSKAVSNKTKVTKLRSKPTSSGNGAASGMSSHLKSVNDQDPTASASANTIKSLDASVESDCTTTELSEATATSRMQSPEALTKTDALRKKEREKEANQHKHRVAEGSKVAKNQRVDGKQQKSGAQRSSNEMTRKSMKGIGIGSNSGMGHLTVRVSS